jgi:hypothetical protein
MSGGRRAVPRDQPTPQTAPTALHSTTPSTTPTQNGTPRLCITLPKPRVLGQARTASSPSPCILPSRDHIPNTGLPQGRWHAYERTAIPGRTMPSPGGWLELSPNGRLLDPAAALNPAAYPN